MRRTGDSWKYNWTAHEGYLPVQEKARLFSGAAGFENLLYHRRVLSSGAFRAPRSRNPRSEIQLWALLEYRRPPPKSPPIPTRLPWLNGYSGARL